MPNPINKKYWSAAEIKFIQDNFFRLTNQQLADSLGLKLTLLRNKCISMGLKRMELEYWTEEQVEFLIENYKSKGDTEIAEIFGMLWPKKKGWTLKHIEKKRRYLKLQRTAAEKNQIRENHRLRGVYAIGNRRMWATRGTAKDGTIRYWHYADGQEFPIIKIDGQWLRWNRWAWIQAYGAVPAGMNIVFKDGNPRNLAIGNLEALTNEQLAARNSIQRYPKDLIETIYLSAKLNRKITKLTKKLNNEKQEF